MNTIQRLNKVIDFIEDNITENIDINDLAKIACFSSYDFQRMFMFITEMSVSEYIRKRRLTLAGLDLLNNNEKVIDVAFKYGYESPISFARAFNNFHGVLPSKVKTEKTPLRIFSRLIFQISVKEVPEVLRKEKITINGKTYNVSYYGEGDMSSWHDLYGKRRFYRIENAYNDFKDNPRRSQVLPYNNYPIKVEMGDVFYIDYYVKNSDKVDRIFYIADGSYWKDMPTTTVFNPKKEQTHLVKLNIKGKEYNAKYLGCEDISYWAKNQKLRKFYKLENAYEDFKDYPKTKEVLTYNNYPCKVEKYEVYLIEYTTKNDTIEYQYHVAEDYIWNDEKATNKIKID